MSNILKFSWKQIEDKVTERSDAIPEYRAILMEAAIREESDGVWLNIRHPSWKKLKKIVRDIDTKKVSDIDAKTLRSETDHELIQLVHKFAFDKSENWRSEMKDVEMPLILESMRMPNNKKRIYRAHTHNKSEITVKQFEKKIYYFGHTIKKGESNRIDKHHRIVYQHSKSKDFLEKDRDSDDMLVRFKKSQTYGKRNVIGFVRYSLTNKHPLYTAVSKDYVRCSVGYSAFILYQNMTSDVIHAIFIAHDFHMGGLFGTAYTRHYKIWAAARIKHFHMECAERSKVSTNKSIPSNKTDANEENEINKLKVYSQLLNMGVADDLSMKAATLFPNDATSAIIFATDIAVALNPKQNESNSAVRDKTKFKVKFPVPKVPRHVHVPPVPLTNNMNVNKSDMSHQLPMQRSPQKSDKIKLFEQLKEFKENELKELERQTKELQENIERDIATTNPIRSIQHIHCDDEIVFHNIVDTKGANDMNDNEIKIDNDNELSCDASVAKHFCDFLKSLKMEKYIDIFTDNGCCDMESIPHFDDNDLKEIGIKSKLLRKKFLAKCITIRQEMNEFKNDYKIPSISYQRLAKYGVVTMNILCNEVRDRNDLKFKYKITNDNQCDLLWNLIQRKVNLNDLEGI